MILTLTVLNFAIDLISLMFSGMVPYSLPPNVLDLGHGIQPYSGGEIESKILVFYLDKMGILRDGYVYKNGSNFRVVRWKDGQRINGTVPRSGQMILVSEISTPYSFKSSSFNASHFNFPWIDQTALMNIRNALLEMNLDYLNYGMAGLKIQE